MATQNARDDDGFVQVDGCQCGQWGDGCGCFGFALGWGCGGGVRRLEVGGECVDVFGLGGIVLNIETRVLNSSR